MIETGKTGLSTRNKNILIHDLNVNPDWLETGRGRMFNAEPDLTAYMHRTDNTLPLQSVPLYSVEGTDGLVRCSPIRRRLSRSTSSTSPICPSATVRYTSSATRCTLCSKAAI